MDLTKSALKKILGRTYATLGSLQLIADEIEALLNDRILKDVLPDLRELAPAHLLFG